MPLELIVEKLINSSDNNESSLHGYSLSVLSEFIVDKQIKSSDNNKTSLHGYGFRIFRGSAITISPVLESERVSGVGKTLIPAPPPTTKEESNDML